MFNTPKCLFLNRLRCPAHNRSFSDGAVCFAQHKQAGDLVMRFHLQLVAEAADGGETTRTVARFDRSDISLTIDDLGLSLDEAKSMLAALQTAVIDVQALAHANRHRACPCCGKARQLKDRRTIKVRTLFGKIPVPSPRYRRCPCEVPGVDAPLVSALPERVTPDLLALEARWASLVAYGVTVKLLGDVLPIDTATNIQTVRNDVLRVAERLEGELGPEKVFFASACQRDLDAMPLPDLPVVSETHMPDTSGFRDTLQAIIADPATSDALRSYAVSAANRDPVDVLAELTYLKSVCDRTVYALLRDGRAL